MTYYSDDNIEDWNIFAWDPTAELDDDEYPADDVAGGFGFTHDEHRGGGYDYANVPSYTPEQRKALEAQRSMTAALTRDIKRVASTHSQESLGRDLSVDTITVVMQTPELSDEVDVNAADFIFATVYNKTPKLPYPSRTDDVFHPLQACTQTFRRDAGDGMAPGRGT